MSSGVYVIELTPVCTSGGIGQATARAFARAGCSVAVHHSSARSRPIADALCAELTTLGVRAAPFAADLSTYDAARALYDAVAAAMGPPDLLFSNHGVTGPRVGPTGDVGAVSAEEFEDIWRTNTGTAFVVGIFLPLILVLACG